MRLWIALLLLTPALGGCFQGLVTSSADPAAYIRDDNYTKWVIEIDYEQGFRPSQSAIDLLKTRMTELVRKDSITVVIDDVISESRGRWSDGAIASLEDDYRDEHTGGDTVTTWVAYLGGEYQQDTALGVTFDYDRIAIFRDRMQGFLTISETDIERSVMVHEFGHAIGLVNRGVPMVVGHEDPDHPRHSSNRNSVMYWAVETTNVANIFTGSIPTTFDSNDKRDICRFGGKGSC